MSADAAAATAAGVLFGWMDGGPYSSRTDSSEHRRRLPAKPVMMEDLERAIPKPRISSYDASGFTQLANFTERCQSPQTTLRTTLNNNKNKFTPSTIPLNPLPFQPVSMKIREILSSAGTAGTVFHCFRATRSMMLL